MFEDGQGGNDERRMLVADDLMQKNTLSICACVGVGVSTVACISCNWAQSRNVDRDCY